MISKIEICNMALGYIGEPPVASLEERRPGAEYCRMYLPVALDMVLREHPWNFAQAREALAPVQMPAGWGVKYRYAYARPPKCSNLHALILPNGERSTDFELADAKERTVVLCDIPEAVAQFTRYIEDSSRFDPYFIQVLARRLQAFIVKPLCKNRPELVREAETLYQQELAAAQLQDAREGRRFQDASPAWDGGHDLWGDAVRRECGR